MKSSLFLVLLFISNIYSHSEQFHRYPFNIHKVSPKQEISQSENNLANVRAITDQGTNAEAYWSFDGSRFSFQAIREPLSDVHSCDQIYIMSNNGSDIELVSTGFGRDTCSYFLPSGKQVLYSSTQEGGKYCPPSPDMSYGYLWPVYKDMSIYIYDLTTGVTQLLLDSGVYDAETTISPDGSRIIFTSAMDGDLELYTMNIDGTDLQRVTYTPGYDGGAYFSPDSKMIVWRANRPHGSDLTDYLNLLNLGIVNPIGMQIYVANADGSDAVQITNNNGTNFAPFFLPDGSGVIFSSDLDNPNTGEFHLYTVALDGSNLTRITYDGSFNSFPMFSPDGITLAWESNRNTTIYTEINVAKKKKH